MNIFKNEYDISGLKENGCYVNRENNKYILILS